jgi:L-lactate dehydrogenase complex protein LldG
MSDLVGLFLERAAAAGCRTEPAGPEAPVVEAAYGIAETGSVVFVPTPAQPRRSWLDAEVLVVELARDRILPNLEALFAAIGPKPPSAVAIVTGPSRTADIEQTLVVGVHGPRELHVVLGPS